MTDEYNAGPCYMLIFVIEYAPNEILGFRSDCICKSWYQHFENVLIEFGATLKRQFTKGGVKIQSSDCADQSFRLKIVRIKVPKPTLVEDR